MTRLRLLLLLACVLAIVAIAVTRPWRPLLHGREAPPAVDPATLEPALAARIAELTDAIADTPWDADAWGRLGGVFQVHDLHTEALRCFARAERLAPDDFRWPYFGAISVVVGDTAAAQERFERAAALRPEYAPVHVHLGRGCIAAEDLDGAVRHFERAYRLAPSMIRPHLGLARVALARNEPERALQHLERALALGPTENEIDWLFAETYRRLGDDAQAAMHRTRAGDRTFPEPVQDPLQQQLGWESGVTLRWRRLRSGQYIQGDRLDLALAEWDEAVAADPASAVARAFRAEIVARQGRPDEAIAELRRAVELDPELALARTLLGSYLVSLGRPDEGIEHLRAAAAVQPGNPEARFNLAMTLRDLDRPDEAAEFLEEVLDLAPGRQGARLELGTIRAAQGRVDEAIALLRAVLDAEPESTIAALRLADVLRGAERPEPALDVLRAAAARTPDDPQIALELAWLLATAPDARLRDGAAARALVEPFCARGGFRDPFLLDALAAACAETGDFDAAVLHATRAVAILDAMPPDPGVTALHAELSARLDGYRDGRPYRDAARAEPFTAPSAPVP